MGDRAVAGIKSDSKSPIIFLYSQWGGSHQSGLLANALSKAEPRWHDASYGTRIILSQLVGDDWKGELGYGIYVGGTSHGADYNHILIADLENQNVLICENENSDNVIAEISFEDFIANYEVLVPNATMELDKVKHEEFLARYPELATMSS